MVRFYKHMVCTKSIEERYIKISFLKTLLVVCCVPFYSGEAVA